VIEIDTTELVTELAVSVISSFGRKLAEPLRALKDAKLRPDLELAMWFDTYKATDSSQLELPEFPPGFGDDDLRQLLESDDIHAILHELLAARLTDAPERDIAKLRSALQNYGTQLQRSWPAEYLGSLFDAVDYFLAGVVGRLEGAQPVGLERIRSQASAARITAILGAIERHTEGLLGQIDPKAERFYLEGYRRHIVEQYGAIEPPDFNNRRRVPIADLYVSPEIIKITNFETVSTATSEPVHSVNVWELAESLDRTVLLGDPGCGKTTASRVLLHHLAGDMKCKVPFLVTLREFAAADPPARSVVGHIEYELTTRFQHPAPSGLVNRLLLGGAAVVVFDGLDELLDASRRAEVSAIIERFCTEYPLAPILVTSRVVGYDQARLDDRQFTSYRIHGFTDAQVAEYSHKWFAQEDSLTPTAVDEWAEAFVRESQTVRDLRANPLLLALMCILYRGEGSIPRNRCDVYERCADLLFRRWDSHRRIYTRLRVARDSDAIIRRILQHLAFWLLTRDIAQTAVTERQLVAETVSYLTQRTVFSAEDEARDGAREFVEFCRGRAWVFNDVGTTPAGESLYTFTHRTFLEYFAACYLASIYDTPEQLAGALVRHVARGEWPVVAPLAVQIKDRSIDRGGERVLLRMFNERRKRSSVARTRVLSFVAECLHWAPLPLEAVRLLTEEILDRVVEAAGRQERVERSAALGLLSTECWPVRGAVSDAASARIVDLLESADRETQFDGFRLAAALRTGEYGLKDSDRNRQQTKDLDAFWREFEVRLFQQYRDNALYAARRDAAILFEVLNQDILRVEDILAGIEDLSPFFANGDTGIYRLTWIARAANLINRFADRPNSSHHELRKLGLALVERGPEKYRSGDVSVVLQNKAIPSPTSDQELFLPCALTIALGVEGLEKYPRPPQSRTLLREFEPYVMQRLHGGDEPRASLPVPSEWQDAFDAWGRRDRNFVNWQDCYGSSFLARETILRLSLTLSGAIALVAHRK